MRIQPRIISAGYIAESFGAGRMGKDQYISGDECGAAHLNDRQPRCR
ncbi:MAG: hypothetical protein U9R43_17120 [Thermodesulfobacteriota bacterium]|nr:hypothetical protein [Thermodesulfobacteriota bacterium]